MASGSEGNSQPRYLCTGLAGPEDTSGREPQPTVPRSHQQAGDHQHRYAGQSEASSARSAHTTYKAATASAGAVQAVLATATATELHQQASSPVACVRQLPCTVV